MAKDQDTQSTAEELPERSFLSVAAEFAAIFIVAYLLAMALQNFVFGNFEIKQHSMEPTLYETDRVFINRLTYRFSDPKRGDIIILIDPMGSQDDFVKRIIGLPGEIISMKDGQTYINGRKLEEPYISSDRVYETWTPTRVDQGQYYVMGDNRPVSRDSRHFGPILKKDILGKVMVVWWPPNHAHVPK
jgi:signal peptidase I